MKGVKLCEDVDEDECYTLVGIHEKMKGLEGKPEFYEGNTNCYHPNILKY